MKPEEDVFFCRAADGTLPRCDDGRHDTGMPTDNLKHDPGDVSLGERLIRNRREVAVAVLLTLLAGAFLLSHYAT